MKRIIPFVASMLFALSAQAQTINVHMTGGTTQKYSASKVEYIDFSAATGVTPAGVREVDLGLPSGIKWANMNIGATDKKEYGSYFAWGETEPSDDYAWSNYKWGTMNNITKYSFTLNSEDDAATANWGGNWRMPTRKEFQELIDNTTAEYVTLSNDSVVVKLTSKKNGNYIYLPTPGCWNGRHVTFEDWHFGYYWTSTLDENNNNKAYIFQVECKDWEVSPLVLERIFITTDKRCHGLPVRPVIAKNDNSPAPGGVEAIDLGLSVNWANMNVGATVPEGWGNYYSWGETATRSQYGWYVTVYTGEFDEFGNEKYYKLGSNYKWGAYDTGMTGYTGATTLEPEDDAATVNWGNGWRTPTKEDFEELLKYTTYESHKEGGIAYGKFTSKINGQSIYLTAGGYYDGKTNIWLNTNGLYHTSTVYSDNSTRAYYMGFDINSTSIHRDSRCQGYNIRPVKDAE